MLTFDPEAHIYRWNEKIVPSVTQVIGEWKLVEVYGIEYYVNVFNGEVLKPETFREAAFFGREVHAGAKLILENNLDWSALDPAVEPTLRQFEKWAVEYEVEPLHLEEPMYSDELGIAGMPDFIGYIRRLKLPYLAVVDWKTGMEGFVGPQTAGYSIIYRDQYKKRARMCRFSLRLPKDGGDYKFTALGNPTDETFFKARAFQFKHLRSLQYVTA